MDAIKYQPRHVQALFGKSPETVRQWSIDFAAYLSPDANPDTGHRRYTTEDLRVLAHVNLRKGEGADGDQIALELAQGERAEPVRDASAIVAQDERGELVILQQQLENAQAIIAGLRADLVAVKSEADQATGAASELRQQVESKDKLIADLNRQIGRLEAQLEQGGEGV